MPKSPDYFHNTIDLPFFVRQKRPAAKRNHFATGPSFLLRCFLKAIPHNSARASDERICVRKRWKTAGILCVLQGFWAYFWRKGSHRAPTKAQQSGFGGERRSSEATELLPLKGKTKDAKLATTQSAGAIVRCCHSFHSGFVEEKNRQSPQTQLCGVAFVFSRYPDIIRRQGAWRNE